MTSSRIIRAVLAVAFCCAVSGAAADEPIRLNEVIIQPTASFNISRDATLSREISGDLAEQMPLIDDDIYRAAQIFPGVTANDFSARFHVRGGKLDETGVRLDGIPLFQPYHLQDFGGAVSTIDLGIVRKARLFMGVYPPALGDWLSGVYDLSTRKPSEKREIEAGIDLVNAHLLTNSEIPGVKNSQWLMSLRRGYIDLIMGLINTEERFEPRYFDLFNRFVFKPSDGQTVSAGLLYALDTNLIDQIGIENDVDSRYENGSIWGTWETEIAGNSHLRTSLLAMRYRSQKSKGEFDSDERDLSSVTANAEFSQHNALSILNAGFSVERNAGNYDYADDEGSLNADLTDWLVRGHVNWSVMLRSATCDLGLAYWRQSGGNQGTSPRLSASIPIGWNATARIGWGLFRQPVTSTRLPIEQGNTEILPPQRAAQYSVGIEWQPSSILFLKVDAYWKEMKDLSGVIEDLGRKEQIILDERSGYSRGIEVFVNHALSDRFSWMLAYTYAVARSRGSEGEHHRAFDQRHSLGISSNYHTRYGVLNLSWRFHTGNPYTESWYELIDGEWVKKYGELYAKRLPAYHSLDIRFSREFKIGRRDAEFYVQIMNLYNRQNVHEYSWTWVEDENRYERVEEHLLPILPTFGVKAHL